MEESKEEFVYFNDEWNGEWLNDPSINTFNFKLIKNNKPDGRRYKK